MKTLISKEVGIDRVKEIGQDYEYEEMEKSTVYYSFLTHEENRLLNILSGELESEKENPFESTTNILEITPEQFEEQISQVREKMKVNQIR